MLQLSLAFVVFDIVCEIRWTHQRKVFRRRPISFVCQTFCRGNETSRPTRFSMDTKLAVPEPMGLCVGIVWHFEKALSISSQAVSCSRSIALEERYVVVSQFTYRPEVTLYG